MFDWLHDGSQVICNLGEVNGIGATAMVIRVCGKTIVIDFGVAVSRDGEYQIKSVPAGNFLIGELIDLIIITHDHLDHTGAVLRLIRHHPEAMVIILRDALDAFETMSLDSIKIMRSEIKEALRKGTEIPEMIFNEDDLENFIARAKNWRPKEECLGIYVIDDPCWHDWPDSPEWRGWEFKFHSSGHDRGATSVFFRTPDDRVFYHTSDISSQVQDKDYISGEILPDKDFLGDYLKSPNKVMITEATNGARNEITWSHGKTRNVVASRDELDSVLEKILREVESRGGIAQIATFAKNRGSLMIIKVIRMGFKVAIDGLLRKMVRDELGKEKVNQLVADGKLIVVEQRDWEIARDQREALIRGEYGFVVIIAPSATLDRGTAVFYAEHLLPDPKNALIIPGHIFPDSTTKQIIGIERGRTIKLNRFVKLEQGFRIEPIYVNVRCDIYHLDYTSHDYQDELVRRVKLFRPDVLVVHHCDDEAFTAFEKALRSKLDYPLRIERATHLKEIRI